MGFVNMGTEFQFCKMKRVPDTIYTTKYLILLNCTVKNGQRGKFCVYFATIKFFKNPKIS